MLRSIAARQSFASMAARNGSVVPLNVQLTVESLCRGCYAVRLPSPTMTSDSLSTLCPLTRSSAAHTRSKVL